MRTIKIILLIIFISGKSFFSYAQDCRKFNESQFCWLPDAKGYNQYGKSRGAYVLIRKTYQYEVVLRDKNDYKIGVCTLPTYNPVQFRVIDKESKNVIYDNSTDGYKNNIGFSVEDKPITVIIEIAVLATDFKPKDNGDMRTCVGVQIFFRQLTKLGF
jgi:hypothetical protein